MFRKVLEFPIYYLFSFNSSLPHMPHGQLTVGCLVISYACCDLLMLDTCYWHLCVYYQFASYLHFMNINELFICYWTREWASICHAITSGILIQWEDIGHWSLVWFLQKPFIKSKSYRISLFSLKFKFSSYIKFIYFHCYLSCSIFVWTTQPPWKLLFSLIFLIYLYDKNDMLITNLCKFMVPWTSNFISTLYKGRIPEKKMISCT